MGCEYSPVNMTRSSDRALAHITVVSGVAWTLHQEAHDLHLAVGVKGDLHGRVSEDSDL
jgi:hypothetical protein